MRKEHTAPFYLPHFPRSLIIIKLQKLIFGSSFASKFLGSDLKYSAELFE
ncbi:Uncharacterised protein [Streptococcus sobrinus]|uniref:Uncharacterized protein n=1 Tax=Streptococcus sobrinus W1703 TaxID=1227275 RepID=U2IW14_9STRE|nr:hypothetical protein HMPREF1557_00373 [Streptococcus sobrinus W1703]SQG12837.1 Uncharacterised protein [Streptococcus sobrinus]